MSVFIHDERCEAFGLDRERVASVARRLSRAAKEASEMGLLVFGGSGTGTLRFIHLDKGGEQDGNFDGGDGGDNW